MTEMKITPPEANPSGRADSLSSLVFILLFGSVIMGLSISFASIIIIWVDSIFGATPGWNKIIDTVSGSFSVGFIIGFLLFSYTLLPDYLRLNSGSGLYLAMRSAHSICKSVTYLSIPVLVTIQLKYMYTSMRIMFWVVSIPVGYYIYYEVIRVSGRLDDDQSNSCD